MTGGYESNEQPGTQVTGPGRPPGEMAGPVGVPPQPQPAPRVPVAPDAPVSGAPLAGPVSGPSAPVSGLSAPVSGPSGPPVSGPPDAGALPYSAPPAGPTPFPPGTTAQLPPGSRRGGRSGLVALVLAVVLAVVAGIQAYQISQLSDRLAETKRQLTEAQTGDAARLDALEGRTGELEKEAGSRFNPEEIAAAVLPSVFRVRAGDFTGTAFAVGKPAAGGGTNLFTNYHVVEEVWESGEREVFLERTDQRFPATIVGVDADNDVAHLTTTAKFDGLVTASASVRSGQQIIVVGAPLGLEDSVTTGIVSAERKLPGFPGTVIQFDAPINPGNSGGPVVNGDKQVVGIATAKQRNAEGIGLAVPIKVACDRFRVC